ncbi:ABC transporter permease [Mesoterricola sediminis]|uniref:Transport permease protein n=1 Tax=Mesoterricola sediminis TaxID=2927980 RepID=A0AA48KCC9_9BACT|nr:ABC transporter permease [Mesoterricola sediminis]BDU75935.1 transport permease protein [Mesoterricola sediminis]
MIRILRALVLRDLRHEASYRLPFVLTFVGNLHIFLVFLFISRLFGGLEPAGLAAFKGGFFPYVLTGIAIQQYLHLALSTYAGQIRESQLMGTFEAVLACPVPLPAYLAGSALYAFGLNTVHALLYLVLGVLLGGLSFPWSQVPLLLLVLAATAAAFSVIGILSASYCVLFKKGNPLTLVAVLASSLLGGVYFPAHVLPAWIRGVCAWVPMTHALDALRGVLLQGRGLAGIAGSLLILAAWAVLGLPLACWIFSRAVARGRSTGSLGQY